MTRPPHVSRTPRRQFIGELAATTAALAAAACAPAAATSTGVSQAPAPATPNPTPNPAPLPPQASLKWDASWMDRIVAKHRAVFDSPEIAEGTALYHAHSYLQSVKDVFGTGDSDASVVVILRHAAVALLFTDAMWAKYPIGELTKTLDRRTKQPVTRNTYYQRVDAQGNPVSDERSSPTIRSLTNRGVIFVGCDMATRGLAYQIAQKAGGEPRALYEELRQNLVPGATLMPTGIFATLLAQEAGCSFMKST